MKSILLQESAIDGNFRLILDECHRNEIEELRFLTEDVQEALSILRDYRQLIEGVQKKLEKKGEAEESSSRKMIRYPFPKQETFQFPEEVPLQNSLGTMEQSV